MWNVLDCWFIGQIMNLIDYLTLYISEISLSVFGVRGHVFLILDETLRYWTFVPEGRLVTCSMHVAFM
jgi:hypothetical protein